MFPCRQMKEYTARQIEIIEASTNRISRFGIQNLTIKSLAEDIGLSEPALYRHFNSKNDILLGLLSYFMDEMKVRIERLSKLEYATAGDELKAVFSSQFQVFTDKPAIVSVIFAESIFHYDDSLSNKVSELMDMMQDYVKANIRKGQEAGHYHKILDASTLTTIIIGSVRMTVLKWRISGHKSNLKKEGNVVLEGILKMIDKK